MKLSKLASITFTALASVVYLFGVLSVGAVDIWAQEELVDTQLEEVKSTSGFGLLFETWWEDMQERFSNNPDLIAKNAEKALARLKLATEENDPEGLEMARQRYEAKLEKLENKAEELDLDKKEALLLRLARHEAVLERVFEKAPESATAGLQTALTRAIEHREKMLLNLGDEDRDEIQDQFEVSREEFKTIQEVKGRGVSEEQLQERRERIERLRENLEATRAGVRERVEEETSETEMRLEKARERFSERVETDKVEAERKAVEAAKSPQEKFKERVQENEKTEKNNRVNSNKVAPMNSENIRKVQGAVDYQPETVWEKIGYWWAGR